MRSSSELSSKRGHSESMSYSDDDDDDEEDDRDTQVRQSQAELAAKVSGKYHRDLAKSDPNAYVSMMTAKYPPPVLASSSSSPSSSFSSGRGDIPFSPVGGAFVPGYHQIVIDDLRTREAQKNIPRSDGYDPSAPREPRYGPTWMNNFYLREDILQSHPYIRCLNHVAGSAKISIDRVISVESVRTQRTAELIRQRITELASKNLEDKMESLRTRERELQRAVIQAEQKSARLHAQETNTNRREALERDQATINENGRSISDLRAKYRRLNAVYQTWAVEVMPAADQDKAHDDFLNRIRNQLSTDDIRLLKDWLYGIELSSAEAEVGDSMTKVINAVKQHPAPNKASGFMLNGELRMTDGVALGEVMESWMENTHNMPSKMQYYRMLGAMNDLPKFKQQSIDALIEPSVIEASIRELRASISEVTDPSSALSVLDGNELQRRLDIIDKQILAKRIVLDNMRKEPVFIGEVTMSLLESAQKEISNYQNWSFIEMTKDRFVDEFGGLPLPGSGSQAIANELDVLDRKEAAYQEREKQISQKIEALDAASVELAGIMGEVSALQYQMSGTQSTIDNTQKELKGLELALHRDTFAYRSRPENSGVAHLHPEVSAALNTAYYKVQQQMGGGAPSIDELMSADEWLVPFGTLVGLVYKLAGMKSGKSFTQRDILDQVDLEAQALLQVHFGKKAGGGGARAARDARRDMLYGSAAAMDVDVPLPGERRIAGFNAYSRSGAPVAYLRK